MEAPKRGFIMKRMIFLSVFIIPTLMFSACEPPEDCTDCCKFDNLFEVRSMTQTYCYCDPDIPTHCVEVCEEFVLPGESGDCRMWLDGYMSFDDAFKGFGTVELWTCYLCPGMVEAACEPMAMIFGTYFYDEGEQELWYFDDGDVMVFDTVLSDQELVLTFDDGGMTMEIVLDNQGPVEDCSTSKDLGRCYTRANCAGGMLLGCVSKKACQVALNQLGVSGSWRPRNGGACVSPLP